MFSSMDLEPMKVSFRYIEERKKGSAVDPAAIFTTISFGSFIFIFDDGAEFKLDDPPCGTEHCLVAIVCSLFVCSARMFLLGRLVL